MNRKKRVQFVSKDSEFWNKVIFSDESKFNIFQNDGRILVWRKTNTEWELENMQSTVKHGGGGVMVWGCMADSGVCELVFIDGTMDKFMYLGLKGNITYNKAMILNTLHILFVSGSSSKPLINFTLLHNHRTSTPLNISGMTCAEN